MIRLGNDFSTSILLAQFGPNATTSIVNVIITNDAVAEPREAFRMSLSLPVNSIELGIIIGEPSTSIAVILDDDRELSHH